MHTFTGDNTWGDVDTVRIRLNDHVASVRWSVLVNRPGTVERIWMFLKRSTNKEVSSPVSG